MDTALSIWDREDVRDRFDEMLIESKTRGNYDLILAQIPSMFGDSDKATYLGFRAIGLRPKQVFAVMGLPHETLKIWQEEFPYLVEFERDFLWTLQQRVNADIIRLQFMRNLTMFMLKDATIIQKGMADMEQLTPREYIYFRTVRKYYDMNQLLNLEKAVAPEKHRTNSLTLNFGANTIQVIEGEAGEIEVVNEQHAVN